MLFTNKIYTNYNTIVKLVFDDTLYEVTILPFYENDIAIKQFNWLSKGSVKLPKNTYLCFFILKKLTDTDIENIKNTTYVRFSKEKEEFEIENIIQGSHYATVEGDTNANFYSPENKDMARASNLIYTERRLNCTITTNADVMCTL